MSKLLLVVIASLIVSVILCYSTLRLSERIAETTLLRTEMQSHPMQTLTDTPL